MDFKNSPFTTKIELNMSKTMMKEISGLKDDVKGLKGDVKGLKGDVKGLKGDVKGLKEDVKEIRKDLNDFRYEFVGRLNGLEVRMEQGFKDNLKWMIGLMVGFASLIIAMIKLI